MKKRLHLFIFLLLLIAATEVQGQTIYFIPKAGLNLANTTNTPGTMKPGLNFGLSAEYMLTPRFSAEAGFAYSMQGAKFGDKDVDLKHDYLNIPVLGKYYVHKGLNVFAGPQLGIKVNTSSIGYVGEYVPRDMTRAVDVAAVIGAGYLLDTGLLFSTNLALGLTDVSEVDTDTHRNWAIQLNFGYRF
ncbi:MAG: PorT family protein [Tannerellaceae bacterium]|jgi:hypothetical protein|nr:PorT family protein [Tannerellaceae bacterium]